MFPDFDTETLQAILQSVNWDEARAIDTLLGMSDPDFRPQEQPTAPRSQTDLDEEFARRLMLEEQQQHEAAWAAQQGDGEHTWQAAQPAQGQQWQRREDRRRRDSYDDGAWERPERQAGQGDFAEIQEQFSKIAETGKKTFNSLFNKVKAKINEYDTGRPGQGSGQDAAPNWGTAGTDQQYQPPAQPPAGQQSYYAPSSASPPSAPVHGYDLGPGSPPRSGVAPSSAPGAKLGPGSPPRSVSSPSNDASRPPTSTGPPTSSIDPTKIGLLPKKPVSLLRDPQSQRQPTEDDDDMYASPEEPDANTAKPSTHDA
ncbi:hypothetical protein PUNSTDRAFT_50489 [Punctularia strigosozonata HHB-11173 SS5]|uniref:uncharacterized protein n=1 Tax=Punctularia strigosozonata (strain HHB-11173) TaxID=741275 RepID=UPI000441787A|nr:uncharacterized protein PUNSTDRAFT_50489 [Punctularia strigosozonata HHB-11173 SS5]EIN11531.1 hypothetical protein PUNSTDRAFT_50489 [Punctularia strigosozonata HHB-11173 SS5]